MERQAAPGSRVNGGDCLSTPENSKQALPAYVHQYLRQRDAERGLSPLTRRNYESDIRSFFEYCASAGFEPLEVDRDRFRGYLVALQDAKVARGSVRRKVSTIHGLYRYLARETVLPADPLSGLTPPKKQERLPHVLSVDHVQALIDSVTGDSPGELRDRAILELLYGAGLRISELAGLELRDIDLDERLVRVTGKGNKQRMALFGAPAEEALKRYLADGRPALASAARRSSSGLFLNRFGTTLTGRAVQISIKRYAVAAGIEPDVHPHLFRHSFATHLLDNGAELRVVQELLGHSSPNTTQIYLHVTGERKREVYDRALALGRMSRAERERVRKAEGAA